MIQVKKETIESIPVLHVVDAKYDHDTRPVIVFQHGFTSAKEHNLHYAYLLAEEGYRVFLPDALYHGERVIDLSEQELMFSFWKIVLNGITEIGRLVEALEKMPNVDESRIGIAGTSMGAIMTFGAMATHPELKVGVSLMGAPAYVAFAKAQIDHYEKTGKEAPISVEEKDHLFQLLASYDISSEPEKLQNRPLLFWHSKADKVVPFEYAESFYEKLKDHYDEPDRLKFVVDDRSGHKVNRDGVLQTVAWFKEHL